MITSVSQMGRGGRGGWKDFLRTARQSKKDSKLNQMLPWPKLLAPNHLSAQCHLKAPSIQNIYCHKQGLSGQVQDGVTTLFSQPFFFSSQKSEFFVDYVSLMSPICTAFSNLGKICWTLVAALQSCKFTVQPQWKVTVPVQVRCTGLELQLRSLLVLSWKFLLVLQHQSFSIKTGIYFPLSLRLFNHWVF